MDGLDFDDSQFVNPQTAQQDANLAVRFYTAPIQNQAKSVDEGRPIFDDTEMVEIRVRGDRNNIVQRPVREEDKRRFRDAYKAYTEGSAQLASGTPLAQWPIMSDSMVEELKYMGFYTVEQVSTASDSVCGKVPGLTSMKQKAAAFLELAKGAAPLEKLQEELNATKSTNEALQAQIVELGRRLAEQEKQAAAPAAPAAPAKK